ncbi:hypothetical protein ACFC00_04030 [Streptomyces adustus]|uniref:hypothetical protein n=1 Tax=Streptomyces adustus TaxID=1609272 RepID=UPI0035D9D97F
MTVEHRRPLDEIPWPEQATLVYGETVELTTPHPPIPKLGRLGPEIVGSRGVIVGCVVEHDERDGDVVPRYAVETEDGSPWRLRPEFLISRGGLHSDSVGACLRPAVQRDARGWIHGRGRVRDCPEQARPA